MNDDIGNGAVGDIRHAKHGGMRGGGGTCLAGGVGNEILLGVGFGERPFNREGTGAAIHRVHLVDFRVRLSSLEAAEVRGEFVDALAQARRVCPHLHLCLQSGSDRVLVECARRACADEGDPRRAEVGMEDCDSTCLGARLAPRCHGTG